MDNIYAFSDRVLQLRIGNNLKNVRLKQNITQQSLAENADISLSTVKKIEKGEIGSFDSFLRVVRILGKLDSLQMLVEEEQMSPNEYYDFVYSLKRKKRKRASKSLPQKKSEQSEW